MLSSVGGAIAGVNDINNREDMVAVPVFYHYCDPAREFWEITFTGQTFIDADTERPIADFRLSSLGEHARSGAAGLPVLFVLKIPAEGDLAAFGDLVVRVLREANRTSLPYQVVVCLPDRLGAQPLRTSKLPPDVPSVLLKASGDFLYEGNLLSGDQLKAALSSGTGGSQSRDLRVELEPMGLKSSAAWLQLYELLSLLNRVESRGGPMFLYAFAVQVSRE